MIQRKIEIVQSNDEETFKQKVQELLNDNWYIQSCNCGFIQSETYDFCNVFQAILTKGE